MVLGDAEELRAVMANLLDNAIKYRFRTSGRWKFRQPMTARFWLRFAIPVWAFRDQLKRVFNVLPCQGAIWRASKAQGLASLLFGPSSRNMEAVRAESAGEGRAAPHHPTSHNLNTMSSVLIVEDEQHLADGLRFNLEAEGYDAEVVGDGEKALNLHGAASPV
jgi:hypothetical protein